VRANNELTLAKQENVAQNAAAAQRSKVQEHKPTIQLKMDFSNFSAAAGK
jgi:hypothetical protein